MSISATVSFQVEVTDQEQEQMVGRTPEQMVWRKFYDTQAFNRLGGDLRKLATVTILAPVMRVDPSDVHSGNMVTGEIQVRAFPHAMPNSGDTVLFAGERWLVTRTGQPTEGGRATFTAIWLTGRTDG